MIEAYFDGCCEPINPGGNASFGAVIVINGITEWSSSGTVGAPPGGLTSNNVAEYAGFIALATQLMKMTKHTHEIAIRGDSKLVVEQLHGRWRVNGGHYLSNYRLAKNLWKKLKKRYPTTVSLAWIPREQNGLADQLSKGILIKAGVEFKLQPLESA